MPRSSKAVKQAIKLLQRQLSWKVRKDLSQDGTFHITSIPHRREHVIYWPKESSSGGPPRPVEYLHELCHAYLAEKVHPQFSAQYFKRGTTEQLLQRISILCKAASDWFADEFLYSLQPEELRAEVREHLHYAISLLQAPPKDNYAFVAFSVGLILAQAHRYLNVRVNTNSPIDRIISIFLTVDPANPSVEKLAELLNLLLQTCSKWQVRLVEDGGLEVWEVVEAA